MLKDALFIEQDSKLTAKEHKILCCILYHIPQYQKLLRANPRLCCILFKYNYYLLHEQQILYSKFEQNALHILLFVKYITKMWKYPGIIDILSFIFWDKPNSMNLYSYKSGLMLYLLNKEMSQRKKIFEQEMSLIFDENMERWRDAFNLTTRIDCSCIQMKRLTYDKQLCICKILMNDLVCCANLSCCKRWCQSKHGFMISPAERDMIRKQKEEKSKNGVDVFEIILNRWTNARNVNQIQNKWYKCKKCKSFYCSRRCQKYDWKHHDHRVRCNKLFYLCQ